jgi:hypothetical protein
LITFQNPHAFLALTLVVLFLFLKPYDIKVSKKAILVSPYSNKKRFFTLLASFIFLIIALAKPVIKGESQKIKIASSVIILLDMSAKMKKTDIYPNRFKAAINKIKILLSNINNPVEVIGVREFPFLITPPTTDYKAISYLLDHISQEEIKGDANFKRALNYTKKIKSPKIILSITDKQIPNTITYILKKDYSNKEILQIANQINSKTIITKIPLTKDKELFIYPLIIGIILFIIAHISLRIKK